MRRAPQALIYSSLFVRVCTFGLTALAFAMMPLAAAAGTVSLTPTYSQTFTDAITGDNCVNTGANPGMTPGGSCSGTGAGWTVDALADDYSQDRYERPTVQTFTTNADGEIRSDQYFGYLDITGAQYGFTQPVAGSDSAFMFFQLTMFSPVFYKNDGTTDTGQFGSGTQYGVQLGMPTAGGSDVGVLLLQGEQTTIGLSSSPFNSLKATGFCDTDNSVPGPGGISVGNENNIPGGNGYESNLIKSDGKIDVGSGGTPDVLFLAVVHELMAAWWSKSRSTTAWITPTPASPARASRSIRPTSR